jgi:hypothetical protein
MDDSMTVTIDSQEAVEFDVGTDGNWVSPPETFSFDTGQTREVGIRWDGDCVSAGSATVSADATVTDGSGNPIGSIAYDREWQIPEAGQIELGGNVTAAGASGKFDFEIENTGCEDVTLTGIGILETTSSAVRVTGGGSFFNQDTGDELVTVSIPIDSSDPTSDTRRDFSSSVTLLQNDTVTFRFDRFERSGNGNTKVDMRGHDVRIRLYLSDGSSTTAKLCDGTCDF